MYSGGTRKREPVFEIVVCQQRAAVGVCAGGLNPKELYIESDFTTVY